MSSIISFASRRRQVYRQEFFKGRDPGQSKGSQPFFKFQGDWGSTAIFLRFSGQSERNATHFAAGTYVGTHPAGFHMTGADPEIGGGRWGGGLNFGRFSRIKPQKLRIQKQLKIT